MHIDRGTRHSVEVARPGAVASSAPVEWLGGEERTVNDGARPADYRWWLEIASRWADCDAYGHVNSPIYYSWFDTALTTMLIERGVLRSPGSPSIGLCVESQCRFLAPVEFPETIRVGLRIGRVGDKSLRYELALFRRDTDECVATGWFVHVFVDSATRRPVPLSARQKAAVADLVSEPVQAEPRA